MSNWVSSQFIFVRQWEDLRTILLLKKQKKKLQDCSEFIKNKIRHVCFSNLKRIKGVESFIVLHRTNPPFSTWKWSRLNSWTDDSTAWPRERRRAAALDASSKALNVEKGHHRARAVGSGEAPVGNELPDRSPSESGATLNTVFVHKGH